MTDHRTPRDANAADAEGKMTRYRIALGTRRGIKEHPDGEYVKFADAEADKQQAVDAKDAEIARLRSVLNASYLSCVCVYCGHKYADITLMPDGSMLPETEWAHVLTCQQNPVAKRMRDEIQKAVAAERKRGREEEVEPLKQTLWNLLAWANNEVGSNDSPGEAVDAIVAINAVERIQKEKP